MQKWLLVERYENWLVDEAEGFTRFGLSMAKEKMASRIRKGDLLFFYVSSGMSKFSDVRVATEDKYVRLRNGGEYDTAFPLAIRTAPYLTLEKSAWLPMRDVADRLSFSAGKDWRQLMRASLRPITDQDAAELLSAFQKADRRPD